MSADELVREWAASKLNMPPDEIALVTFEAYDGCYSEYTQDWGVDIEVRLKNGQTRTLSPWSLPEALKSIAEFEEALERADDMHSRHGWNDYDDYDDEGESNGS